MDLQSLKKRLESPVNKQALRLAERHQERLRFHTEASLTKPSRYVNEFLDYARKLLPGDKFQYFLTLFRFPVHTVELVNEIYLSLEKVFDGRDAYAEYRFTDEKTKDDFLYYLSQLGEQAFWKQKAFQQMKTSINSVMVVDLPSEQTTELPEPYCYFVQVEDIVDFEADQEQIHWIAFVRNDQLVVLDKDTYGVYSWEDGQVKGLISENPHDLGYCPARWFWTKEISDKTPYVKEAPITNQLDNLDHLLFFAISKRHLDLYAAYPIYSGYEQDCDYTNKDKGVKCDKGFLRNTANEYLLGSGGHIARCPVCGDKRLAGPGTFVEVPIPREKEIDLRNPVQILPADSQSLNYNVAEVKRLRDAIYKAVVGFDGEVHKDQAVNERQITAAFEQKTAVLVSLKRQLEAAHKWYLETIARLRYGGAFVSAMKDYGTSFYLYTAEELYAIYQGAKKAGAGTVILDEIYDQIIASEYRNNPDGYERAKIIQHLEDYRHITIQEAIQLYQNQAIDISDLTLKLNLSNFVERFEREEGIVSEFGYLLPMDKRISLIKSKLKEYASEIKITAAQPGGTGTQNSAA